MGRKNRYIPAGGALVEVTCRTIQGRLLLRPSREVNETIVGVLARAQQRYPVELSAAVYLSNHCHLLAWVEETEHLSKFMGYLNGNVAREVGRLHAWREKFWAHRYEGILVSEEEEAQVARLKYLLSHGVKEGLVARPTDWPGVHCACSLVSGEPLEGVWIDRTALHAARGKSHPAARDSCLHKELFRFHKLPCWRHLDDEEYRRRILDLLAEIEQEALATRRESPVFIPGARKLRRQDPHTPIPRPQKGPAPQFHAFRSQVREEMRRAYALFLSAYRVAAERLRRGERDVRFPPGCFPPRLPYVPIAEPRPP